MSLFSSIFYTISAFSSYVGEYVVRSFLPNGVFLPCDHGLDGGALADFFIFSFFPCSADHERDCLPHRVKLFCFAFLRFSSLLCFC